MIQYLGKHLTIYFIKHSTQHSIHYLTKHFIEDLIQYFIQHLTQKNRPTLHPTFLLSLNPRAIPFRINSYDNLTSQIWLKISMLTKFLTISSCANFFSIFQSMPILWNMKLCRICIFILGQTGYEFCARWTVLVMK